MIQKGKAQYLLKKTYDKSRTLESFCKYEQKRFNQAQFNSTYCQKIKPSPSNGLVNTQTDKKVDQIKIKYGLYPKRLFKHQRSMTTGFQNKENRSLSRQPLADHTQKFNTFNFKQQSQEMPQNSLIKPRVSVIQSKNKQNPINAKTEKDALGNLPKKNDQKLTFKQSSFNDINLIPNSHISPNIVKNGHERKKTEHITGGQAKEKKVLWQSNLNPRIENINKINSKIKLAIENANQIPLSQKQNFRAFSSINKQYAELNKQRHLQNDMIQTRIVQKGFLKQYNTLENSYFTGGKNINNIQSRPIERTRAFSVNKNYNSSTNYERQFSTSFKPQKDLYNQKLFNQNVNSKPQTKKQIQQTLNEFSFENEQQQMDQNKQQTVRKNRPIQQNKFNTIRIKQDKSQYFDQVKPINTDKNHAMQSQKLSSMIKLALSSISAKKQTNQTEKNCQNVQKNISSEFKSIQNVIKRQIQLDQMLRKAKYWLKYHNNDSNLAKLRNLLFQKLSKKKYLNNCNQIQFFNTCEGKNILRSFQISDEQIDPFYSVRVQEFTYDQIIETYLNAQDHWKHSLQNQKIIEQMISTKWISHIDMENKGFANVTDLTRFINFVSQGFYKNRDLVLLYRRLTEDFDIQAHQKGSQEINRLAKPTSWFKQSKGNKLTQDSLKRLLTKCKFESPYL